ncbi:MAG: RNA polymerase sigma factor [Rhodanobacter sp.]
MERRDLESELERLHSHGFAWAVRCCRGDRTEAEDVLQLAYVKILEGKTRFEGRSAFRTWLFGVIRYTAQEQQRWRWNQALRLGRWWREQPQEAKDPVDVMSADESRQQLRDAMSKLSARQGEVLHLVFYQDLTIQEAADVLEMRVGTARTHYERGKARLRTLLGGAGGDG